MAEYIEREALIKYIERLRDKGEMWSLLSGPLESHVRKRLCDIILSHVKCCPAADVVEVVRCKDCIFNNGLLDFGDLQCRILGVPMKNDDFCSYGERKNDETD